jgi:hypothetical protein
MIRLRLLKLSLLFAACCCMAFQCEDRFDCDDSTPQLMNIKEIVIKNALNTGGRTIVDSPNAVINRKNYLMNCNLMLANADTTNMGFFQGCNILLASPITSFKINTVYNLTPQFPSGSDVTTLFQMVNTQESTANANKFKELTHLLGNKIQPNQDFYLTRFDKINPRTVFKAEVVITTANNNIIKASTDEIILD